MIVGPDINPLLLLVHYWPWLLLPVVALVLAIGYIIHARRQRIFVGAAIPQFSYSEEEDAYYYRNLRGVSTWVTRLDPPLPPDHFYDEEKGRFYVNNGRQESYWIKPEEIDWNRPGKVSWTRLFGIVFWTFVIGIFIAPALVSDDDPRGNLQALNLYRATDDNLIVQEYLRYWPGSAYQTTDGRLIELPVADSGFQQAVLNESDALIRVNRYTYFNEDIPSFGSDCNGQTDGELVFAYLPGLPYASGPVPTEVGMVGYRPETLSIPSISACTSILVAGLEFEAYDPSENALSPEDIEQLNARWLAEQQSGAPE